MAVMNWCSASLQAWTKKGLLGSCFIDGRMQQSFCSCDRELVPKRSRNCPAFACACVRSRYIAPMCTLHCSRQVTYFRAAVMLTRCIAAVSGSRAFRQLRQTSSLTDTGDNRLSSGNTGSTFWWLTCPCPRPSSHRRSRSPRHCDPVPSTPRCLSGMHAEPHAVPEDGDGAVSDSGPCGASRASMASRSALTAWKRCRLHPPPRHAAAGSCSGGYSLASVIE